MALLNIFSSRANGPVEYGDVRDLPQEQQWYAWRVVCTCPRLAASPAVVPLASPVILLDPIGMSAVGVVWPSFVIHVDKSLARSAVSALNAVLLMTVPETTG